MLALCKVAGFPAIKVVPQKRMLLSLFSHGKTRTFLLVCSTDSNKIYGNEERKMKKFASMLLVSVLSLSLFAGCGQEKKSDSYRVAIVQQLDHSSLEEIRLAAQKELDQQGKDKGLVIEYEHFNGQNDPTILGQIGSQIAGGGFDAILPIGTLAAQYMVSSTEGMEIPIVYAAISDPAAAGLTDLPKVTGTSDALNTQLILDMMLAANPNVKTVGLLYSNSEPNSQTPIAQAKKILEEKGIAYLEKTGNTADEVLTAASALAGRVDAVFTPTDNAVMNVAAPVAEILNEAKIPHYTGADSFVAAGSFATCGVNYSALGTKTAQMTVDLMVNGNCPAYHVMEGGIITYNSKTAEKLGLDPEVFRPMADSVKDAAQK